MIFIEIKETEEMCNNTMGEVLSEYNNRLIRDYQEEENECQDIRKQSVEYATKLIKNKIAQNKDCIEIKEINDTRIEIKALNEKGKELKDEVEELISNITKEYVQEEEYFKETSDLLDFDIDIDLESEKILDRHDIIMQLNDYGYITIEELKNEFLDRIEYKMNKNNISNKDQVRKLSNLYFDSIVENNLGKYEKNCELIFE